MQRIFQFILIMVIVCSSSMLIHANKNEKKCKKWCKENSLLCKKCSKWRGCGAGYHTVKKFRGRGKDWFACGNHNKADCEKYCKTNSNCVKCSRFSGCGTGYRRMKKFNKHRGRNWHACKKETGTSCFRQLLLTAGWNGNLRNPVWTTTISASRMSTLCAGAKIKKVKFSCSKNNCDGVSATYMKMKIGTTEYSCNTGTISYGDTDNNGYNEYVSCEKTANQAISAGLQIEVTANPVISQFHTSAVCDTRKLPNISITLEVNK
ncbi:MAG: hypothetical protein GY754_03665 [bacterium]|nr:hypothetical protein [bacterium]